MARPSSMLLIAVLASCGGGAPPARSTPGPLSPSPAPREDARALGPRATFRELVRAARTLDDRRDQDSTSGCLVGPGPRLEADLAAAVRPLPLPPATYGEQLGQDGGPVTVLTRWGAYGSGDQDRPTFVAFTSTVPPRRAPAMLWVIGVGSGIYVRRADGTVPQAAPTTLETAVAQLDGVEHLFVSGVAGVPLPRLVEVLGAVPDRLRGRVALAVSLEPGTRLPATATASAASVDERNLCPDGLPGSDPPRDAGVIDVPALQRSIEAMRRNLRACIQGVYEARLEVDLRLGPDGVEDACIMTDSAEQPLLRACVVEVLRAGRYPRPNPPGEVRVALPLVLSGGSAEGQRPLCP